jgi:hypothetical protein
MLGTQLEYCPIYTVRPELGCGENRGARGSFVKINPAHLNLLGYFGETHTSNNS